VRFVGTKKFVELRGSDARPGEHGVSLAAMVDLMLKEVRQKARRRFVANARAAKYPYRRIELAGVEPAANVEQTAVDRALRLAERFTRGEGLFGLEKTGRFGVDRLAAQAPFEGVDVEPIDRDDMVERGLEGRKEARSRRGEFARRQLADGAEKSMVRPRVIEGHRDEVVSEAVHPRNFLGLAMSYRFR
jgi:hypothetical protein